MAEVFAGHSIGDHGFQKPVAIKRLLPELANDHVFVERLIEEAKLLVGMQHGNIVSVLDLARDGDDVFLVMEFVDGPSLRQLLKARGQRGLSVGTATYIVQAAAAGLELAHARPGGAIIHADISPSNLLLTTSGEVRVADFGIARREGGGYGIVEGKWAYMAPEQARGEPLTPRSDVFALGVVLYELICGAHPFGRQVTAEERDSEPMRVIPPRVVKPSIPPGIDAICMRALAHDPRERYARMQQLIDAIVEERFSNGWREGASDLAQAIRECSPQSAALQQPRTMITDRPVTIATRSLLRDLTPARRPSVSASRSASATPAEPILPILDSGRQTNAILADDVMRAAALLELPAMLRADGTPMPPFKLSDALMPGQDLASVIGGHTVTGGSPHVVIEPRGTTRWTIGVLAVAAVIGAIAAVAMQLAPSDAPRQEVVEDIFTPERSSGPVVTPADEPVRRTVEPAPVEPALSEELTASEPAPPITTTEPDLAPAPPTAETLPKAQPRRAVVKKQDTAILRVQSDPWAYATIAGYPRVETPGKFTLPPGKYNVRFESDDGRRITKAVSLKPRDIKILTVNLDEDL
jgi:serine/threonine protein kinase